MEKTPDGTPVGVEDPYEYVDRCDFVTDEGKCRWAREHCHHDPEFANARSADGFRCPAAVGPDGEPETAEWDWKHCPKFRCRNRDRSCLRCGLNERRIAHDDTRPLLEEHHLSYATDTTDGDLSHEITVYLCRWCHAKVHNAWARIDDDVAPDPDAIAEQEQRRSTEAEEFGFQSAAERYEDTSEQ
jgi:hypothetical protein